MGFPVKSCCFIVLSIIVFFCGCGGYKKTVNTVRITSIPEGAKLYINGFYVGCTPQSIAQKCWSSEYGTHGGQTLSVKLVKNGYKSLRRKIDCGELAGQWLSGNYDEGSEHGNGNTYQFIFPLRRQKQAFQLEAK